MILLDEKSDDQLSDYKHTEGNMNACSKLYGSPSNSSWDISSANANLFVAPE